jgi:tripartite-type tricarboxylate transporter receptor subunit TctC
MDRRTLLGLAAGGLAAPALAQAPYPNRPIRMVVPLPAGGATDIWARLVAEPMAAILGQPVVIENRAGAGGMIGTEAVKNAPADGYTILFHISNFVQTPAVLRRWPYRVEDFAPVGKFGTTPLPFCVRADIPATTLREFVSYARGRQLAYGTYSPGTSGHAFAQALSDLEGLEMTAVHYRGEAPMLQDVLGGRIPCAFHSMTASGDQIRSGRIRPLATLGPPASRACPLCPPSSRSATPTTSAIPASSASSPPPAPRSRCWARWWTLSARRWRGRSCCAAWPRWTPSRSTSARPSSAPTSRPISASGPGWWSG